MILSCFGTSTSFSPHSTWSHSRGMFQSTAVIDSFVAMVIHVVVLLFLKVVGKAFWLRLHRLRSDRLLIPIAIDANGHLGPMFQYTLYGTIPPPIPPRKQFKVDRPNAKVMYNEQHLSQHPAETFGSRPSLETHPTELSKMTPK